MRQLTRHVAMMLGLAGSLGCGTARAQSGNPHLAPVPPGHLAAPTWVLTQYLLRRREITATLPVVSICGPDASQFTDSRFVRYLQRPEAPLVRSLEAVTECANGTVMERLMRYRGADDLVIITAFAVAKDSAFLRATVKPRRFGGPPHASIWDEGFNLGPDLRVGMMPLVFTNFRLARD